MHAALPGADEWNTEGSQELVRLGPVGPRMHASGQTFSTSSLLLGMYLGSDPLLLTADVSSSCDALCAHARAEGAGA